MKLLLNLVMIATTAIPRGGSISVTVTGEAESCVFTIVSKGLNARIPAHAEALLAGRSGDGHRRCARHPDLLCRACGPRRGMSIAFSIEGDEVTIRAATT